MKDKSKRIRKDWAKGERKNFNKNTLLYNEDAYSQKEKIKPKSIDIASIDDVEKLPLGTVVACESGKYEVEVFPNIFDVEQIIRTDNSNTDNSNTGNSNTDSPTTPHRIYCSWEIANTENGEIYSCYLKRGATTMNENSTMVVIGDVVRVQRLEDGRGLISHIEKRVTKLGRQANKDKGSEQVIAANIASLVCVVAADRPDFRRNIIDRFIIASHLGGLEPIIVINKSDTMSQELRNLIQEEMQIYESLGYKMIFTSVPQNEGISQLRGFLENKTSSFLGQSGVGKSSLANLLTKSELQKTGEVRQSDARGRHTTIGSRLLQICDMNGKCVGKIADTPGLREFGIWDLLPEELDGYFIEFATYLQDCKYKPCTHTHEPACAVISAVHRGDIDQGRYSSYLSIFQSLK